MNTGLEHGRYFVQTHNKKDSMGLNP